MKYLKLFFALCLMLLMISGVTFADDIISTLSGGAGDWNNTATWDPAQIPTSADNVTITAGDSVYLSVAATCANLTIESGAKLSLGAVVGGALTVSSSFTIQSNGWYYDNTSNTTGFPVATTMSIDAASNYVHTAGGSLGSATSSVFGNLIDKATTGVTPSVNLTINGNLTIDKTGTNNLRAARNGSFTHTIKGNLTVISGGMAGVDGGNYTGIWNIDGNVTVKSSTVALVRITCLTSSGAATTAQGIYNIKGNLTTESGTYNGVVYYGSNSGNTGIGEINVGGNIVNNGAISKNQGGSPGTFLINFNGTSPQTFTGNSPVALAGVVGDVKISNSNGVTLNSPLTLNDNWRLNLSSGNLYTTSTNLLRVGSGTGAGIIGGSSSSYVNGPLLKSWTTTGSFLYPIGKSAYSPITLDFTSGTFTSASATVEAYGTKHANNSSATDYLNRYWTVTQSGIAGFTCNADFVYVDGDIAGTESNYTLGQYNGIQWVIAGTVDPDNNKLSAVGLSSFSDFTGGEASVLPVQLASFVGNVVGNNAQLEWQTISEINNYGFNVQRYDAISKSYNNVGFVAGKGIPYTYTYEDKNVSGSLEYRLEQIDNNGLTSYFGPIMLNPNSVGSDAVPAVFALNQNYPNPFNPSTIINYQLAIDNYTTLKVYNLIGKEVATLVNGNQSAGSHQVTFDGSALTSGVYFYKLQSGSNVEVKKLTLVK
jgi:hypothetical protein